MKFVPLGSIAALVWALKLLVIFAGLNLNYPLQGPIRLNGFRSENEVQYEYIIQ